MTVATHTVRVLWKCRVGHEHTLCVPIDRGVPPELRCDAAQGPGYGPGGNGCTIPADLSDRVERQLRDNFQDAKRNGMVIITS